jgi:hypothetical protein
MFYKKITMGKAKKEHRAKVAKRNQRMGQEKSKMQKVFNSILEEQMKKFQDNEELNIQVGDSPIEFNVIDPNDVEEVKTTEE